MNYIIFDLEFNQDFSSLKDDDIKKYKKYFEIVQIGAIKLDKELNTVSKFNRLIKPTLYKNLSPFVNELTGITIEQLNKEETFLLVFKEFVEFMDGADSILCTWGMSDLRILYNNVNSYKINLDILPKNYINIQPYTSIYFGLPVKTLLRLEHAVDLLNIPKIYNFHDAINDAYYTAEIFKRVYNSSIKSKIYDPNYIPKRPIKKRLVIDTEKLINQFEKMYERKMTEEEKEIILLAYKMGKTKQFLK